ncbi:hypothetical protein E1B28_012085 [Marasmius oreades]|uniref:Uncharacterized protein n=1 Tax=Marasmius oreades TaxID=181124 RepID=A0A9P7UMV3_9AGAR|nr:uncharacterized protein E1B28_012085 [Marasmius oreades]KAG7088052.1 hypothetical protein E1B28_012085 [Marasmius oreades]
MTSTIANYPESEVAETEPLASDTENHDSQATHNRTTVNLKSSDLKVEFKKIYQKHGSLKERRLWLRDNLSKKCNSCEEKNLKCLSQPDKIRCEACARRKEGSCSKVAEEKKDRVMKSLKIDASTYDALLSEYNKKKDSKPRVRGRKTTAPKKSTVSCRVSSPIDKVAVKTSVKKPTILFPSSPPRAKKSPTRPISSGTNREQPEIHSRTVALTRSAAPAPSTPSKSKLTVEKPNSASRKFVRFLESKTTKRAKDPEDDSTSSESSESEKDEEDKCKAVRANLTPLARFPRPIPKKNAGLHHEVEKNPDSDGSQDSDSSHSEASEQSEEDHRGDQEAGAVLLEVEDEVPFDGESVDAADEDDQDSNPIVAGQKVNGELGYLLSMTYRLSIHYEALKLNKPDSTTMTIPAVSRPAGQDFVELHLLKRKVEMSMQNIDRRSSVWCNLNEVAGRLGDMATSQMDEIITKAGTFIGSRSEVEVDGGYEREGQEPERKRLKTMSSKNTRKSIEAKQRQRDD